MQRKHVIRTPRELEALRSTVRQGLIAVLEREGPLTVREMAAHLERTPESLYHHVRVLEEAGLLLDQGKRPGKRRPESVYALVARAIQADPRENAPAFLEVLARTYEGMLRLASKRLGEALRSGRARRDGRRRDTVLRQYNLRLDGPALAELNERLQSLSDFLRDQEQQERGGFYTVTFALSPESSES